MSRLIDLLGGSSSEIWFDTPPPLGGSDASIPYCEEARSRGQDARTGFLMKGGEIRICGESVAMVLWYPGAVSTWTAGYRDAVSFDFSGCLMAAYEFGGERRVAHIQRGENDRLKDWLDFLRTHRSEISNLVMFRPDADEADRRASQDRSSYLLWGIITAANECYSLCVRDTADEKRFSRVFLIRHDAGVGIDRYGSLLDAPDPAAAEARARAFFMSMTKTEVSPRNSCILF